MPPSTWPPGLSTRRSTSAFRTRQQPTSEEATICQWDPHRYSLPFDRMATRLIRSKSSEAWSLRRDIYFLLYGCLCFGLVPITAHILVPNQHFLPWYATNIAELQLEYYFKTGIQAFSLMFVSLVAMVFTGNNSTIEICARNGAGLAVWIIFFIRMSEGMLRDAALHMGLIYRAHGGELKSILNPQSFSRDRYPQQALKWAIVIEFEIFIVIYAFVAIKKFREVRKIDRSCNNMLTWKSLLRQTALNTSAEEHDTECS